VNHGNHEKRERRRPSASARAAQAALLLLGFNLLVFAVLAALLALDVIGIRMLEDDGYGLQLLILVLPLTVLVFWTVVRGLTVSVRLDVEAVPGVPVTPEEEPDIWALVRRLALATRTRGPDHVLVGTQADAMVWEGGRLLGLLPGKRYLIVGAPLLIALSPGELEAVLAHEFGHYGNGDTRLIPLVNRGRISIRAAIERAERRARAGAGVPGAHRRREPLGWWYFVLALRAYAHVFFSLTQATSRAQEYAADHVAAGIAGRDAIASALAELPAVTAAYALYLKEYVCCGAPFGLVPEPDQVIGGFRLLVHDQCRRTEFDPLRRDPPVGGTGRFDAHPPLPARIKALRSLPDLPEPVAASHGAAARLLRDERRVLTAVGRMLLGDAADAATPMAWAELVDAVAYHSALRAAAPLAEALAAVTGRSSPTVRSLLFAADEGLFGAVIDKFVASGHHRTELAPRLRQWVLAGLAEAGRVCWRLSWSGPAILDARADLSADLDIAVAALLFPQRPDSGPLWLIIN